MMATKKSEEKEKKLFPKKQFYVAQLPGCCGIGVISDIQDSEGTWDFSRGSYGRMRPAKKEFFTKEEQAEAVYKEMVERTASDGWGIGDGFYSQLLISLVSNYDRDFNERLAGQHQFPELQDILLREGWTIYSVFVNPNHKNEVTLYGKYFPERDKHPDDDE
jgi:hypothetical protein